METDMDKKIGVFPFKVAPFSEDFSGHLSWGFLGNHLLRCASSHAGTHGFGLEDVVRQHHAWVLSRLVVEMENMPRSGETYTVETWVSNIYRQFTDRLFRIVDESGHIFGHAFSIWALIDSESREALDFSTLKNSAFTEAVLEKDIPISGPGRVRVKSKEPVYRVESHYSDLDINGHVNSIRYLQMVLDVFTKEIHDEGQQVHRIEMAYCSESYCGEALYFYREDGADGRSCVEIRKEDGQVVVKAAVELRAC